MRSSSFSSNSSKFKSPLCAPSMARINSSNLTLYGFGIPILSILDEKYHEKGHNRRAGIDDQLPRVTETDIGPVRPHTTITDTANTKADGRPVARAVALAKRVNRDADFVGFIGTYPSIVANLLHFDADS